MFLLSAALLALAATLSPAPPSAPAPASAPAFRDIACGVTFQHPADVTVNRNAGKPRIAAVEGRSPDCSLGITYPEWSQSPTKSLFHEPEFPVIIDVFDAPFDAVAAASGFDDIAALRAQGWPDDSLPRRDIVWTVISRNLYAPATPFARGPRFGVRGRGWSRVWADQPCDPEKTGCVGSIDYEIAVVCDAHKCASIFSYDSEDAEDIVDCVLETFAADPEPSRR